MSVLMFENWLREHWKKSVERLIKFQEIPYISSYARGKGSDEDSKQLEKRVFGVIHELLSLTLWKNMSIAKLVKFQREFRDGYVESELVEGPLVVVKENFRELMQEGHYEYTEQWWIANLEKRNANRPLWKMNNDVKGSREIVEPRNCVEVKETKSKEEFGKILQKESKEKRYREEERTRFKEAMSSSSIFNK